MKNCNLTNIFSTLKLVGDETLIYMVFSIYVKRHEFETILISNDAMNTQDGIGKGIGSRERE